jgi:hypothetical protein
MMMRRRIKKSIEDRIALFEQFHARRNARPLLGFFMAASTPSTGMRRPGLNPLPRGVADDDSLAVLSGPLGRG